MESVHLGELELVNFRNFKTLELSPGARFNILSGSNGVGKTNLLEAIYMFGVLRSFRTTSRRDLILSGQDEARARGTFLGALAGLSCHIAITHTSRTVRADGKTVSATGGHFRSLPMVLFHPATMGLVQSGPDGRRRFLNRALFQAESDYPALHRDYIRALSSRNRLLKERSPDHRALSPFDEQLADLGAQIMAARERFLAELLPHFLKAFEKISLGLEAKLSYKPKVEGGREEILAALENGLAGDVQRGFTSVGPHGDDFQIDLGALSARKFASQGQQRMLALALKIAETNVLAKATDRIPILLMDDISSELDRDRNRELFSFLASVSGQVFITTTHLDHILIEEDRVDFQIQDGSVSP
jgi:DNA replication and repair protein RecF